MNVVDSSGWLEYFSEGQNASFFAPAIEKVNVLIVPVITLYEVFKKVLQQKDEQFALQAVACMQGGQVVDVTPPVSLMAARLSLEYNLPMADALILTTARSYKATLWTQDADFKNIPGVRFCAR